MCSLEQPSRSKVAIRAMAGAIWNAASASWITGRRWNLITGFVRSRSGNIAMVFGLTIAIVFGAAGAAIDYGRWLRARSQTQNAVDAAVLAAGRVLQTSGGNASAALSAAHSYYDQLKPQNSSGDKVTFSLSQDGSAVEAATDAVIVTPFLSTLGIDNLPVKTAAKAVRAVGGNAETSIEIGLMLDITGSMSGDKITDLKLAAKDLVNIVVWDNQSEYTSKVALAPFAPRVNVGGYVSAVTGLPSSKKFSGKTRKPIECVTERTGTHAFTDEAPGTGSYLGAYTGNTGSSAIGDDDNYSSTGNCSQPSASEMIVPLTNDKAVLTSRINDLSASGSTAGQLGTAWAWYLISPKWADIWPDESRPAAYSELTTVGSHGQPKLQKIAILMTDGVYNTKGGDQYGDSSSTAVTLSNNSIQICENMKAAGVIVYAVGFDLGGSYLPIKTLSKCASSPEHFYNTTTGDQLRQAFRDIALKISTLRLAS
ncbi:MAG: pilus assembly protein [Hyphomicrobiaceae bacterium]|nr:pilus assembly protein [Hyphomicrobiaceae bacterium]